MRNHKFVLLLGVLFFLVTPLLHSQISCGFDVIHQRKMKEDPSYREMVQQTENWVKANLRKTKSQDINQSTAGALYTIPVVVHVLHTGDAIGTIYNPSDLQIQQTIDYLNQVYSGIYPGTQGAGNIQIQFALAILDPNCNPTNGILRVNASGVTNYTSYGVNVNTSSGASEVELKTLSQWDSRKYYNIWVVNKIDGKDGTSGSFVAGYAYFPGSDPSLDGTVMLSTQMKIGAKTLPHEVGHAFGLYHPFSGPYDAAGCPTNTDCSTSGDYVCDTDPVSQPSNFACRTGNNPCTNTPYSLNTESNYMNYTSCATLFTEGQKSRMLTMAASANRISLTGNYALTGNYPIVPFTEPKPASCTPQSSKTGLSASYAGILSTKLAGRVISSSSTNIDKGYLSFTSDCQSLIPLLSNGSYVLDISVLGVNTEQLAAWIDYNNNGIFEASEQLTYFNETTQPAAGRYNFTVESAFSIPSSAVLNTPLRMRVVEDLGTSQSGSVINNGCYAPIYGQVEDYNVYIYATAILRSSVDFTVLPNGTHAFIQWEDKNSQNVQKYVLQRSMDRIQYSDIEAWDVNENSTMSRTFTDIPGTGKWYYRLKIVYNDLHLDYSNIQTAEFHSTAVAWARIIQNPVNEKLTLEFNNPTSKTNYTVIDLSGRILKEGSLPENVSRIDLNGFSTLRNGIYFLELNNKSGRSVIRFMKQ
ncbi:MAG: zinc-dependent metalloprotease [Chitinophagaceae bacterium]